MPEEPRIKQARKDGLKNIYKSVTYEKAAGVSEFKCRLLAQIL
jgi:hypothetical protein